MHLTFESSLSHNVLSPITNIVSFRVGGFMCKSKQHPSKHFWGCELNTGFTPGLSSVAVLAKRPEMSNAKDG